MRLLAGSAGLGSARPTPTPTPSSPAEPAKPDTATFEARVWGRAGCLLAADTWVPQLVAETSAHEQQPAALPASTPTPTPSPGGSGVWLKALSALSREGTSLSAGSGSEAWLLLAFLPHFVSAAPQVCSVPAGPP